MFPLSAFQQLALNSQTVSTHPVTISQLESIYRAPFFDLIQRSRSVHLQNWDEDNVQLCTLLSVKTGGCSEDSVSYTHLTLPTNREV